MSLTAFLSQPCPRSQQKDHFTSSSLDQLNSSCMGNAMCRLSINLHYLISNLSQISKDLTIQIPVRDNALENGCVDMIKEFWQLLIRLLMMTKKNEMIGTVAWISARTVEVKLYRLLDSSALWQYRRLTINEPNLKCHNGCQMTQQKEGSPGVTLCLKDMCTCTIKSQYDYYMNYFPCTTKTNSLMKVCWAPLQ